ncbi:MAG: saccharopine dehydrogenase [Colwellia sp.]|nr:saccharopine dehydrogenase [Colwellia sp.]
MTKPHLWLRAETKPLEERIALTPNIAKQLLAAGFQITVEESEQSAISSDKYQQVGCEIQPAHSWRHAPEHCIILGLKELSSDNFPLIHNHIHFAHVYKNQQGWQSFLQRFVEGKGQLFDLEYLVDENKRRIAAFGYWAGFAGAAVALKAFAGRCQNNNPILAPLSSSPNKKTLVDDIKALLNKHSDSVKMLVIGAKGRSGRGAVEMAELAGINVTQWDIDETKVGGAFPQLLVYDVIINCVFVQAALPPFLTTEMLQQEGRRLAIICDVSCDPYGDYNPLPIYDKCTTFSKPTLRLIDGKNPLDLIAIDHLPSLLPVESSEDFCQQLLPHLLQLNNLNQGVWQRANDIFVSKLNQMTMLK